MENCAFCRGSATLQCQRCREFYCSAECQTADWQNHKFFCVAMPALIKTSKSYMKKSLMDISSIEVESQKRLSRQNVNLNITQMRLPYGNQKFSTEASKTELNSEVVASQNQQNMEKCGIYSNKQQVKDNVDKNAKETSIALSSLKSIEIQRENTEETIFDEKSSYSSIATNGLLHRSKKIWKTLRSYPNGYFNAIVQYADHKNNVVWVSDEDWNKDAMKLLSETNHNVNFLENVSKDDVCYESLVIAPFEDLYYRAIVIVEINPFDEIKVRLLDYGNEFFVQYKKCKKPNAIVKNFPAMAFAIKYPKKVKIGESIKIKVSKNLSNNLFSVEEMCIEKMEIANYENTKSCDVRKLAKSFDITKTSVLSTLKDEFVMKAFHRLNINSNKAFGIITQDEENVKNLLGLSKILNDDSKSNYYSILETSVAEGSYIAAEFEPKNWRRGLVVGNHNQDYLVLFIDDGELKIVQNIKRLPEDFRVIPSSTVCIDFSKIKNKKDILLYAEESITLICKLQGGSSNCEILECSIFAENSELGIVSLTNFDGNYKNFMGFDTYTYPFRSGNTVYISRIIDYSTLTLSLEVLISYYENIFNEIGESIEAPQSKVKYNIGDTILFKPEHVTKYIRGNIVSIINDSKYEVLHSESECLYQVSSHNIRQASDFVKFCPLITRKVSLYILNLMKTGHESNRAIETLKKLNKDRQILIFEWEKDLVELFLDHEKTKSLNKMLISELYEKVDEKDDFNEIKPAQNETLKPGVISTSNPEKKNLPLNDSGKNKIYKLSDLKTVSLKAGENIRLLILDTSDIKSGIFTAAIDDLEYYKELNVVQQPKIGKYCHRDNIEKEYYPIPGEICFTLFKADNNWYRALCFKIESNDEFNLMFLDFGNIQLSNAKQIRKMTKEFLFPCYANTCILLGLPPKLSENSIKKLHEAIHPDSIITVDKVEKAQDQEYLITIKGIENI
ncbi:uncharacterized protein LOC129605362 isoform X1 [Condylostylus longicornis]|uniref:uncharacterized protein LOC129605362 isoform X1 n=1 Tax=Condylostylus longicornis TaxID=2530218 RepID=UPI00244D997D|nr:uncharacterized protein LOC129605362 isoform X1 [Condylostylus longicornis]